MKEIDIALQNEIKERAKKGHNQLINQQIQAIMLTRELLKSQLELLESLSSTIEG